MSVTRFIRILSARWWIVLITLLTCVASASLVARLLPQRYDAQARVLLDDAAPDPVTGQKVEGLLLRLVNKTHVALITDFRVAETVVDRVGWIKNPTMIALWRAETGGSGDMRRWAAQRIIDRTSAGMVNVSNILQITYQDANPLVAQNIVGILRKAFIDYSLNLRTQSADQTADHYDEQVIAAKRSLDAAETREANFEKVNAVIINSDNIDSETSKLADIQAAMLNARSAIPKKQFEATRNATISPLTDKLRMRLVALNGQIELAAQQLGEKNPTYKMLLSQRDVLNSEITRGVATAKESSATQIAAATQSVEGLETEFQSQSALALGMKGKLIELAQLQLEVAQRRSQYESAVQNTAKLRLEANAESGIIEFGDATVSGRPSFPNWPLVLGLSTGVGLIGGIAIALVTESKARRVRSIDDLVFAGNAPVLAFVDEPDDRSAWDRMRRRPAGGRYETPEWRPAQ